MSLRMRSIIPPPWRFLSFLNMLYGHVSGNNYEVAFELLIFVSWIATIWGLWTSRKANKFIFLPLILSIFKLMNFSPPREFVWFVQFDEIQSFFPLLGNQIYSDSPDSIDQQERTSWKIHILDNPCTTRFLIHFHIHPLLWMSNHCGSTSRNHRTELPSEHWEQHHCTGRSQPCGLCNTNHYCQFQPLTNHQPQSLSILHESVFRSQYIRSPCPIPCSIFAKTTLGPGFVPSIRTVWSVFAVRMKKHWIRSCPFSALRRLIRLGGCPGWSESSLGAQMILLVLSWGVYVSFYRLHCAHLCLGYSATSF